jgi:Zn-dependent metalloprotease
MGRSPLAQNEARLKKLIYLFADIVEVLIRYFQRIKLGDWWLGDSVMGCSGEGLHE